jgi:non-specific serine/threonine protein kinase
VGRADEIAEVIGLLGRSRLVTLAGPAGAGKTRLALEAAGGVLERFPDGVWLAELAAVRDPALVGPTVAASVGLDPSVLVGSGRPFDQALCDQLRHRRLLLVLDNCEHLVGAAATLAHSILTRCPDVVVLSTSREVLAVAGEAILRVGPLSLPPAETTSSEGLAGSDAVTLFCARARESTAGFALTEANAGAVARICRRLDGIPLALELAAARMRLLGAQQLADRLDDRFRLLAGGPRTADPRHQTLQAAIDWSHDLLSEAERTVLRRLAVFPSDFSLEAAEAVAAGSDEMDGPEGFEVLDIVGRLADKSLLLATQDEDGSAIRYRLLETVRQYGIAKLAEAGETVTVHARHRDFFTPSSADWIATVSEGLWLRWADAEADNFRAALEWSAEQGDSEAILRLATPLWAYWFFVGTADAADWLERAVAAPGFGDISWRINARIGLALLLVNFNRDEEGRSRRLMSEALALALEHGDAEAAAWVRHFLAQFAAAEGRLDEHDALTFEAMETFRSCGRRQWEAFSYANLAWISMAHGDLGQARGQCQQAAALIGDADSYVRPHILGQLALMEAAAGDAMRAEHTAAEAVSAARSLPGRQILIMALVRSAEAAVISSRPEQAAAALDELLGVLRDVGIRMWVAEALELTAIVLGPNRPVAAATLLGSAMGLRGAMREEAGVLAVLTERLAVCRAQVLASLGSAPAAEQEHNGATMHPAEVLAYARAQLRAAAASA